MRETLAASGPESLCGAAEERGKVEEAGRPTSAWEAPGCPPAPSGDFDWVPPSPTLPLGLVALSPSMPLPPTDGDEGALPEEVEMLFRLLPLLAAYPNALLFVPE